jgi:hypothetical protein
MWTHNSLLLEWGTFLFYLIFFLYCKYVKMDCKDGSTQLKTKGEMNVREIERVSEWRWNGDETHTEMFIWQIYYFGSVKVLWIIVHLLMLLLLLACLLVLRPLSISRSKIEKEREQCEWRWYVRVEPSSSFILMCLRKFHILHRIIPYALSLLDMDHKFQNKFSYFHLEDISCVCYKL